MDWIVEEQFLKGNRQENDEWLSLHLPRCSRDMAGESQLFTRFPG